MAPPTDGQQPRSCPRNHPPDRPHASATWRRLIRARPRPAIEPPPRAVGIGPARYVPEPMLACVVEHVPKRPPRQAHEQPPQPARQGRPVLRFDDQVQVVAEDRIVRESEAGPFAACAKRAHDHLMLPALSQRGEPGLQARGDVNREPCCQRLAPAVRPPRPLPLRLPPRALPASGPVVAARQSRLQEPLRRPHSPPFARASAFARASPFARRSPHRPVPPRLHRSTSCREDGWPAPW